MRLQCGCDTNQTKGTHETTLEKSEPKAMASIAAAAAAAAASEPLLDDVPTTRSNNPEEAEEAEGIRDTQKEEDSKEKDVENDEDVIDEEQLNEFRDQLVALGTFPVRL